MPESRKAVYFLGIGGIGMSALARYYLSLGYRVAGYDKTSSPLLEELVAEGVEVVYDEAVKAIPSDISARKAEEVLWVYTPAVPAGHPQLTWLRKQGIEPIKRAEVLGRITQGRLCLAVAGTHGKTTTSTLLAHLLRQAGRDCTAFLGGISVNYQSNFLLASDPDTAPVIVEADEFDRSFLQLRPDKAIVTSVDADHLDIYGEAGNFRHGFEDFVNLLPAGGLLIQKEGLWLQSQAETHSYSIEYPADFRAVNIRVGYGHYIWDLETPVCRIPDLMLGVPGRHNLENAVAASALALDMGLSQTELKEGLASFRGVKRRFETHITGQGSGIYIDDYAHHPEELKACISSVKELYPSTPVTGIFQPHLYSRTRDFMDEFANSLSLLDCCILMDIYPAREEPIDGISSAVLLDKVRSAEKHLMSPEEILSWVQASRPEILLTLGAGDIDRLVPSIREVLQ